MARAVAEATFGITYDGPALETGEMAVRDLAPALLALGELFTTASIVMFPNREPVALNIKATGNGSFWVQLAIVTKQAWDESIDIWSSDPATGLANLLAAIYGGQGVLSLIKRLRGERLDEEPEKTATGYIRITLPDGTLIEVPPAVWTLYLRPEIRQRAREVVAPLRRDGVDTVDFRESQQKPPELVIATEDVPAFDLASDEDPNVYNDSERVTLVEIVSLAYVQSRKWRLREGAAGFDASIQDLGFWERVHSREVMFAEGDMLRVRLRVVQTIKPNGKLHADYYVVEVMDVIAPS